MARFYINSKAALDDFVKEVVEAWNTHHYVRGSWRIGKDRSLDQNSASHCWYQEIADTLKENSAHEVKQFCKLHFGVPILRAENEEFRDVYDRAIKDTLTYEQKLKAMDFIDVTSIMSTDQMGRYMVDMQTHYWEQYGLKLIVKQP